METKFTMGQPTSMFKNSDTIKTSIRINKQRKNVELVEHCYVIL